jgi:AcrR family transcriptional regulator
MAASDAGPKPPKGASSSPRDGTRSGGGERYRPLPTGTHGLAPEQVRRDQRERLQQAMVELIAEKGYQAVRIVDLAKLAHVSQPTFYRLFADKDELFCSAYDEIAQRNARAVLEAYGAVEGSHEQRVRTAMRAFADLAVAEPDAVSLMVLGAFGAGTKALEHRRARLRALDDAIRTIRDGSSEGEPGDLTVMAILGGIREVAATLLREGRQRELPGLADQLTDWALSYPPELPPGLAVKCTPGADTRQAAALASARARQAEGRLPSGRSELPRQFIVKSQQERIVDATAAIVAEKGLSGLTIPEIVRRANISNQTFYDIYASKQEAYLGALKVGLHQALSVSIAAYEAEGEHWPRAIAAGLRTILDYMHSEPAHARLTVVDAFAASPEAIAIRNEGMRAFVAYIAPGYELNPQTPPVAAEAITGAVWQIIHHFVENDCIVELPAAAPHIIYMVLAPFVGAEEAAREALRRR